MMLEIVPVGHTTLWRLEKAGRFPRRPLVSLRFARRYDAFLDGKAGLHAGGWPGGQIT
jgi:hypothetical protein